MVNWEWIESKQEGPRSETLLELPGHPCPEALWAGWGGLEVSEEEGGRVGMRGSSWSLEEGGMPLWVGAPHRAGEGDRLIWGKVT